MSRLKNYPVIIISCLILIMVVTSCTKIGMDNNPEIKPSTSPEGENMNNTIDEIIKMRERVRFGEFPEIYANTIVYNAEDLGVSSDGKTDVTAQIEDAIKAVLEKGGGILYFPSKKYRINSTLHINNPDGKWLLLSGNISRGSGYEPYGTSFQSNSITEDAMISIDGNNIHLQNLSINATFRDGIPVKITGNECSLYRVKIFMSVKSNSSPCIEISGSLNSVRTCNLENSNKDNYVIEFTKYEGREANGNALFDCHFGGDYKKITLISSHDPNGAQENLMIFRNLYLVPGKGLIDIEAVNGLEIINNMLDCSQLPVNVIAKGFGVYNVEIKNNWMGGTVGGAFFSGTGGNIEIEDNYIWAPFSIYNTGLFPSFIASHNYCVLTDGSAFSFTKALNTTLAENKVVRIGGSGADTIINGSDDNLILSNNLWGEESISKGNLQIEETNNVPLKPLKERTAEGALEVTGDVTVFSLGFRNFFNVTDFGAKGDGISSDTEAISSAIKAALKEGSATVFFPAGTYLVDETINISKDDSKVLVFIGEEAKIVGDENLSGPIFDNKMKYNFFVYNMSFDHHGIGSCIKALYIQTANCFFTSSITNPEPLLWFHGSNCWVVSSHFETKNSESYCISYTRNDNEISINDFIMENQFTGIGKGIKVGDKISCADGRIEGLKINGNIFENTGATQVEVYEILHINIAYNEMYGAENAIRIGSYGFGPDGIYIDHNVIKSQKSCITSFKAEDSKDYISMVVIHDNSLETVDGSETVLQPISFTSSMIH